MLCAAAFFHNFMCNTLQGTVNFGSGHDLTFFDDWHAEWDSSISGSESRKNSQRTIERTNDSQQHAKIPFFKREKFYDANGGVHFDGSGAFFRSGSQDTGAAESRSSCVGENHQAGAETCQDSDARKADCDDCRGPDARRLCGQISRPVDRWPETTDRARCVVPGSCVSLRGDGDLRWTCDDFNGSLAGDTRNCGKRLVGPRLTKDDDLHVGS